MNLYKKATLTLKNDFHNTSMNVRVFFKAGSDQLFITKSQLSRIESTLCGHKDCSCGKIRQAGVSVNYCPGDKWAEIQIDKNSDVELRSVSKGFYAFEYGNNTGRLVKQ